VGHAVPRALVRAAIILTVLSLMPLAYFAGEAAASSDFEQAVDMTFPLSAGSVYTYRDDYHDCRGGSGCPRAHRATDLMAAHGVKVYAATSGVIGWMPGDNPSDPHFSAGYAMQISGDDGRTYAYYHLGRDDESRDSAFAAGLSRGDRVTRGQHIGYVGSSGNASVSAPHLHFEIHDSRITDPYGTDRINPYASLLAAEARGDYPGASSSPPPAAPAVHYLSGDWNADGHSTPGMYVGRRFLLWNSHDGGTPDISFNYGVEGDVPIVGDWNGDGATTVGILRDGIWHLRFSNSGGGADLSFRYGRLESGDYALAGDWNADGTDTVGIVRDGVWHLRNVNRGGVADIEFRYGRILDGDVPVVGDWTGDGTDTPGIVRGREWHLRYENRGGVADQTFNYGVASDVPVVGDWNHSGQTTVGIVRDDEWHLRNTNGGGGAHIQIDLGS
jgi:hypothetical protein